MLMAALGACAAITARLYAQRKGWNLEGVDVEVEWQKVARADYPSYQGDSDWVNDFQQRITFHGDLNAEQKARLLEIAGKCPVHRILTQPNFITETLVEETPAAADVPPSS
jgi:putative redox protein